MNRILILAYGVICYGIFFAVFLYLIGFNADMLVPKSVSSGTPGAVMPAILTNLGLIVLFGVQHTVAARAHGAQHVRDGHQYCSDSDHDVLATLARCGLEH